MNQLSAVPASSGLRDRLVEDMTVRGFSAKTRKYYLRIVSGCAAFLGRSPATATAEGVRRFQIHQSSLGIGAPSMSCTVAALRFFSTYTLDRPDLGRKLIRVPYGRKCRPCSRLARLHACWHSAYRNRLLPYGGSRHGPGAVRGEWAIVPVASPPSTCVESTPGGYVLPLY